MHHTSTARTADLQLHSHLLRCRARGGLKAGLVHRLQCWSEAFYDTVAPRLVTTTALVLAVALVIDRFI